MPEEAHECLHPCCQQNMCRTSIGQLVEGEPLLRSYPRARILNKAFLHRMPFNDYLSGIIVKVEPHELKTTWFNSLGGELLTHILWTSAQLHCMESNLRSPFRLAPY